ncbi:MAG: succinate dehydrogenase assembly factor 2, partial [Proteobacteria bacterium]|nr:succinate dehydrogenase assembly factor 2 [Pseudomonadota bacterium]
MNERLKKGYLQWRCRRGTKELDVVLNRFLDAKYDSLTDIELHNFDALLNTQDTVLWYWLIGE